MKNEKIKYLIFVQELGIFLFMVFFVMFFDENSSVGKSIFGVVCLCLPLLLEFVMIVIKICKKKEEDFKGEKRGKGRKKKVFRE